MRCTATTHNGRKCHNGIYRASGEHACYIHATDAETSLKRKEARQRGGKAAAAVKAAGHLGTPKRVVAFLGALATRLEREGAAAVDVVALAHKLAETALRAVDVVRLEQRVRELEAWIAERHQAVKK